MPMIVHVACWRSIVSDATIVLVACRHSQAELDSTRVRGVCQGSQAELDFTMMRVACRRSQAELGRLSDVPGAAPHWYCKLTNSAKPTETVGTKMSTADRHSDEQSR